ncbi:MAG: hypothetical protein MUO77_01215 [Anaerolineales bacterium]|nr:hypothetical protein [Anaerolineales bacterium]
MDFIVALLKKLPWVTIAIFFGGLLLGLLWGWGIAPVQWTNVPPSQLGASYQEDYMRMTLESFRLNSNPNFAVDRWKNLGSAAPKIYQTIKADPRGIEPFVFERYEGLITSFVGPDALTATATDAAKPLSPIMKYVLYGGGLVLLLLLGMGGLYMYRLLRKTGSGEPTAVMQAVELSKQAEKTNFESLGLEPPITQIMTTYILGDDLYDESFSIDAAGGEFMGEYGVGVSETIGVGDPKKITALEIWLFDKNDIKTATKVLMSAHAFSDPGIRSRLEPKGELVMLESQKQVILETETLQLLATITDIEYGTGPLPEKSYFERVTLELAIWPKSAS